MDNSINYLITLLFSSFFCYRTYYLHQNAYPYYADHHSTMSKKIVEMSGELLLINIDDVEWMQYMEDRGSLIRWDKDYGYDNFKYVSNRATYIHDNDEDDQEDDLV